MEAEPLYQRALETREQKLGPEHPDTAKSLTGLAFLYVKQGKYVEAEPLYQRALRIREQALGSRHPQTIGTRGDLIALLHTVGQHEEAAKLETTQAEP